MRKTAVLGVFLAFSGSAMAQDTGPDWTLATRKPGQPGQVYRSVEPSQAAPVGTTCFIKGERESGQNKMCFYDCLGSEHAINIASYAVCAPQIRQ